MLGCPLRSPPPPGSSLPGSLDDYPYSGHSHHCTVFCFTGSFLSEIILVDLFACHPTAISAPRESRPVSLACLLSSEPSPEPGSHQGITRTSFGGRKQDLPNSALMLDLNTKLKPRISGPCSQAVGPSNPDGSVVLSFPGTHNHSTGWGLSGSGQGRKGHSFSTDPPGGGLQENPRIVT